MANAKVKLQPVGGNILVKPDVAESTTASGLVISASAKGEKPQRGTVMALGTGKLNDKGEKLAFNVAVGDVVIFKKYSPDEVEVDDETYLIMDELDILAIVK